MAKPKSKPRAPKESEARARAPSEKTEVQRRWDEYWERRAALEAAVTRVRDAQQGLSEARQAELELRREFDEAKLTLKQLLDVEPVPPAEVPGLSELLKPN